MQHRCAVCWEQFKDHEGWFAHNEEQHGAVLREFGYGVCKNSACPGVEHNARLRTYGTPPRRREVDRDKPIVAKDGTVFTPQRLPLT